MKRAIPFLLGIAVICGGCIVQSLQPFYTNESKVTAPELKGEWELVSAGGKDVAGEKIKPWMFDQDKLITYDEHQAVGPLDTVYFKIGDALYCDFTADELPNEAKINDYWKMHTTSVHMVCRVELKDGVLRLLPLSFEWLKRVLDDKKVSLPYLRRNSKEDDLIFTATSADWIAFLKNNGSNPDAFPTNLVYVLKKRPSPSP